MELAVLVCSTVGLVFSLAALGLSIWNTIHIQAQKLSTHTVIPISPQDTTMSKIEDELNKIVRGSGGDQSDLNRNLYKTGLDPEDLV